MAKQQAKRPRAAASMGLSPSIPTPRKVSRGRTVPRAAATNMPDTMKPPFFGGGAKAKRPRKVK